MTMTAMVTMMTTTTTMMNSRRGRITNLAMVPTLMLLRLVPMRVVLMVLAMHDASDGALPIMMTRTGKKVRRRRRRMRRRSKRGGGWRPQHA